MFCRGWLTPGAPDLVPTAIDPILDPHTIVSPEAAAGNKMASGRHGFSFHDFLSAINPLQYLPVVGTIYRAVTGDVIPEPLPRAGSLLVSGLLGGPIGVITSIATTIAEKATGIDPEKIIAAQFHAVPSTKAARDEAPLAAPALTIEPASSTSSGLAMTSAQLAAYGVRMDASGTLRLGDIEGADVLNSLELGRLSRIASVYAANQSRNS
jgi:hypothetical protein